MADDLFVPTFESLMAHAWVFPRVQPGPLLEISEPPEHRVSVRRLVDRLCSGNAITLAKTGQVNFWQDFGKNGP